MKIRNYYNENLAKENIIKSLRELRIPKTSLFACIGTDRSTGDSFGPFVGNYLQGFVDNTIGSIDEPLHATNLHQISKFKYPIVAIDSGLGKESSIGAIILGDKPLKPGNGVGKEKNEVGDYKIVGIVNNHRDNHMLSIMALSSTRLSLIIKMANVVANSIIEYVNE